MSPVATGPIPGEGRPDLPSTLGIVERLPRTELRLGLNAVPSNPEPGIELVYIIYGTRGGQTQVLRVGETGSMQSRGDAYRRLTEHPDVLAAGLELSIEVLAVRRSTAGRSTVGIEIAIREIVGLGPWDHAGNEARRESGSAIPTGNRDAFLQWHLGPDLRWNPPPSAATPRATPPPRPPPRPRPTPPVREPDLWSRVLDAYARASLSRTPEAIRAARDAIESHATAFPSDRAGERNGLLSGLERLNP